MQPRGKTSTWLIIGGVVLALVVCCGLAAVVGSLAGGLGFFSQVQNLSQNLPPEIIEVEETLPVGDAEDPFQDTQDPAIVDEATSTSEPAPYEPQSTPVLPDPQGQRMEFTDDFSTNDNDWVSSGGDAPPRRGYLPSIYFIETTREKGEYRSLIPKLYSDQFTVKDFEIEFDGMLFSGDGYFGLDFHFVDDQNYYQVAIKDGSFLIRKMVNGQLTNLTHGPWVRSNSIWETGPNHIKVICHGDVIRLEVNDELVAQLQDDSLPVGDTMLYAGILPDAPDGTTAEAHFANIHAVWWK